LLLQHLFNGLLAWTYCTLVAFGFYFASVGCRHFNFTTGFGYLLGPYIVLFFLRHHLWPLGVGISLLCCAALGALYHSLSARLSKRGLREGQLLIISLGIMAAGENGLALVFGSTSQTLWPFTLGDVFLSNQSIVITKQEFISVLVGSVVIVALLFVWRRTTLGIALRALLESRRNLMLRGYNVNLLEKMISSIGFLFVGVAGLLWAVDSRVRPSMALEASLIGVVTFIVGSILAEGLWGLLFASLAIAVAKLLFSLFLEGDWGMTVPLFVFLAALLVYRGKLVLRVG